VIKLRTVCHDKTTIDRYQLRFPTPALRVNDKLCSSFKNSDPVLRVREAFWHKSVHMCVVSVRNYRTFRMEGAWLLNPLSNEYS
jgi:hypothetical protein